MLILSVLVLAAQPEQPIHLVCLGAGSANRLASTFGSAYDNRGHAVWGQAISQRDVPFDDQVNIDIDVDGTGRVRLPRAMLPRIHGGSAGWFKIKNVVRTENEITGSVGVNFINSPKLRLDRLTGNVSISGKAGDYSGTCQPYDPVTATRQF